MNTVSHSILCSPLMLCVILLHIFCVAF